MDSYRVTKALQNLLERGIIKTYHNHYDFTDKGHSFTNNKSNSTWCSITTEYNKAVWLKYKPNVPGSWDFVEISEITDAQFKEFCNYFEITIEKPIELCNEVEFMDI